MTLKETTYRVCVKCKGVGKVPDRSKHMHPDWKKVSQALELKGRGFSYNQIGKKMGIHDFHARRLVGYGARKDYPFKK